MIIVVTKYAEYEVDRIERVWRRVSVRHPRSNDGVWVNGGFTIGGSVGDRCYAHYEDDFTGTGALGRWTSPLISVTVEGSQ